MPLSLNSTERRPTMCEICNDRFNNCPACCDDGEPDNLEQPTGMNYMQANDILSNYIARNPPEIVISNFKFMLAEYMVGLLEPKRILKLIKEL